MGNMFKMYRGLRKEVYILCFGRFVTAMGSLIWPMLTLILKSKLGFNAEQVALWFLVFGILQVPFNLISGKMTDRFNKRNLILFFDLLSVAMYITTACLPLSTFSLCIYYIGSLFQHMEWPAYDSLIAELTTDHEREKAYSLQYLASNLGVVFAPTLGGLLFNNYLWLSFLLCGLAVLSSTILIFLFIPKTMEKAKITNTYEIHEKGNLLDVLKGRKILFAYTAICCANAIVYHQFNYLLPIQMDEMFLDKGAMLFGVLTSINGAVVIFFTPILTQMTLKWDDLKRIILGVLLQIVGISSCYFFKTQLPLYIIAMFVFTLGEILHTLGNSPYISKRMPASHRGRFTSINNVVTSVASSAGNTVVGKVILLYSFREAWILVFGFGAILQGALFAYRKADKKRFELLYNHEG